MLRPLFLTLLLLGVNAAEEKSGGSGGKEPDYAEFLGKFQRYSIDNYEEYLEALDVNIIKRKVMVASNPVLENRKDGDRWTTVFSTALKNWEVTYELGKEVTELTPDGREVTTVVEIEGDTMIIKQHAKTRGEQNTRIVRKFVGDEVVETDTIQGKALVATQRFKRY